MKNSKYPNAAYIKLEEYLPAGAFRTVFKDQAEVPHGQTEIFVQIELAKNTKSKKYMPACYKGMMFVYGFARENPRLAEVFSGEMAQEKANRKISLFEWEDRFLIVFENGSRTAEKVMYTGLEDVQYLMENCLHPNR